MNTVLGITSTRLIRQTCVNACASSARPAFRHSNFSPALRTWQQLSRRNISTPSSKRLSEATLSSLSCPKTAETPRIIEDPFVYTGPLSAAFRRLKIFSLASFSLSLSLSPFLLIIESNLPMNARLALATVALGTSGLSTALVAWCAKPYVTVMHRSRPDTIGSAEEVEMTTYTLLMRPLKTKVYDPSFLIETKRPLAKWELAEKIHLTPSRTDAVGSNVHPVAGHEETVAETRNEKGEVIGRWVVKWDENGAGVCHEVGYVVKYFNVHEELLQ